MKLTTWENAREKMLNRIEKLHPFTLPKDKRSIFIHEIISALMDKATIVKPEKKRWKRVYVIVPKEDWEKWNKRLEDGKKLKAWKHKIANMDFDVHRQNNDRTKAIFEIKLEKGKELDEFIDDNFKTDAETGDIKGLKSKGYENSYKGKRKFIKRLSEEKEWTTEPNKIEIEPVGGGKDTGGMFDEFGNPIKTKMEGFKK